MQRNREKNNKSNLLENIFLCFCASMLLWLFPMSTVSVLSIEGYENTRTKEVNEAEFLELLIRFINEERSFKGLVPLIRDDIAAKVASDQASDLIAKGYLSYNNLGNQNPDERYTLSGGTGVITEIIKGFEKEKNENKIKLTKLLAHQLIEATCINPDDSQVLFSPYLTHLGAGFAISKDSKKFVSVVEFLTKGGEFEPLKPQIYLGEKISVYGKINPPYKFKAVSVAYLDELKKDTFEEKNSDYYFDNENLKPYFPPQDYIAFGDKGKSNFIKFIKGLGFVGAIGAAPFTGGATAVLAPVILSSIQNGPPREIPLKRGIKANSKGEFSGQIDLNYQGMTGLYFISVLAELPGVNFPIIISRRTVKVISPLQSIFKLEKHISKIKG